MADAGLAEQLEGRLLDPRVAYVTTDSDLDPGDQVLEVGCGPGRSALALADFLADGGRYEGIDVDKRVIRWCRRHVTSAWPEARFTHVDV